jgi:L-alanine-DL-glutamate epimerase-like enolase superfamily enzyme
MKVFVESVRSEPVIFRTPLKFGASIVNEVIMPVVTVRLNDGRREGIGIGAMPLGNAWSFPSVPHDESLALMRLLTEQVGKSIHGLDGGHSIFEMSHAMEETTLRCARQISEAIPELCALVVFSPFDIACFDAWGKMAGVNTFVRLNETPEADNLSRWLDADFQSFGMRQVVRQMPVETLPLFHLVGGLDPLTAAGVTKPVGDGLPEHLGQWIEKDQLTHLKIKLRGDDPEWDFQRIVNVDRIASAKVRGEPVYSLDFNEKCPSGTALVELLTRLQREHPRAFDRVAYVEQPTSRELRDRPEDRMHEAAKLKPVVIDEALTDYDALKRARGLGYSGVALKACKGIGPSLLMAAACRKDNLFLCVQDLTCPGLSLLASTSLAAWLGVAAIEANARQFCPGANEAWARKRPEVFTIRDGRVKTSGFNGVGLGFGS